MNKLILNAISLALLSTALTNCDGSDKESSASRGTFPQSAENGQPDVNAKPVPIPSEQTNGSATSDSAVTNVASASQNKLGAQPVLAAVPGPLATSECAAPSLDDAATVSAALSSPATLPGRLPSLVPAPVFGTLPTEAAAVTLSSGTIIQTQGTDDKLATVADYLKTQLKKPTGFSLPVNPTEVSGLPCIKLEIRELKDGDKSVGADGYSLMSGKKAVVIRAANAAGLFNGVQTLLQLLPPKVYSPREQATAWTLPSVSIADWPRFAYRGTMLDVARTFFTVDEVKRLIDELALLKVNILHLHLTDDQGWRIAIDELPQLTAVAGHSQIWTDVNPINRFFYTRDQYRDIVAYAGSRFITVVPEIEGPGHATAARAALPGLSCDGAKVPKSPSADDNVGTPIICLSDASHRTAATNYLKTVIASIAALTPGPYIHIGSDETSASPLEMTAYTAAASDAAKAANKTLMGWNELATGDVPAGTVLQYWKNYTSGVAKEALKQGAKFVMSPSDKAYLDQGYLDGTPKGNRGPSNWAGEKDAQTVYDWDPTTFLTVVDDGENERPFLAEKDVLGVEGTYWSEYTTADHTAYLDYMVFPRMASLAEIGWSPLSTHSWDSFKVRLGDQGARWEAFGVGYHRTPEVKWKPLSDMLIVNEAPLAGAPETSQGSSPSAIR
jgi:hexosaminidase